MNSKKTIEHLFYAIIFLLPWQGVWIWREPFVGGFKWEYGTIGIYGIDFLILLFLILSSVNYLRVFNFSAQGGPALGWQFLRPRRISLWLTKFKIQNYNYVLRLTSYVLVAWSFLSIIWSSDKILAGYFSFKLLLAVGLFWVVRRMNINWRKLVFVLMLTGALQGALATGQFLAQNDFSSTLLGTSQHVVSAGGTSVIETPGGRWLRAYGTFPHPNVLGGYLTVILLLIIFQDTRHPENIRHRAGKTQETSNFKFLILKLRNWKLFRNSKLEIRNSEYVLRLTSYVLIFSGLVVSFSRSAWLVFAIGFILLFIFKKDKRRELGKLVFVFSVIALVWIGVFSPLFFSRIAGEERLEKKSFDDRSAYVLQSKEIIKENFWLGTGAGNYTKAVADKNPQKPIWQIQPVHNVFLLVWSELGAIGLVLLIAFLFLWAIGLFLTNKYLPLLIVPCLLFFVFDHWLWTSHFGLLFLFLILALILKKK